MFPNMSEYTLKSIAGELVRARKKHPKVGDHLKLLESYVRELRETFEAHHNGRGPAFQIQAVGYTVAAMAIRCVEEGTKGARFKPMLALDFETDDPDASQFQPVGD